MLLKWDLPLNLPLNGQKYYTEAQNINLFLGKIRGNSKKPLFPSQFPNSQIIVILEKKITDFNPLFFIYKYIV